MSLCPHLFIVLPVYLSERLFAVGWLDERYVILVNNTQFHVIGSFSCPFSPEINGHAYFPSLSNILCRQTFIFLPVNQVGNDISVSFCTSSYMCLGGIICLFSTVLWIHNVLENPQAVSLLLLLLSLSFFPFSGTQLYIFLRLFHHNDVYLLCSFFS